MASSAQRFAVVGGGIAGMAAAFTLHRDGHDVEVLERDAVLGGRLGVDRLGNRDIMMGGKNLGRNYSELRAFLAELGARDYQPFGINNSRVIDGKLQTLDSSDRSRAVRRLREIGSARDAARLLYLGARVRADESNRFLGGKYFTAAAAKHDGAPLSAHFGARITRNLLRPITVRMNGAEPDEVYIGTFGTNLAMMMDTFDQLNSGIRPVLDEFGRRIPVRYNTEVRGLVVRDGAVVGLRVAEYGKAEHTHEVDGVVLATPAYATAQIVDAELPGLSKILADVRYFPATVAVVEYATAMFTPAIRAISLDDGPCSNAGAYGVDDLNIVRYTFSGRQARPVPSDETLRSWIDDAEARIRGLLGRGQMTRMNTAVRRWDAAYCAYLPGHGDFLAGIREEVGAVGGLRLAGDYLRGAPLEACFRSGTEAAKGLPA